MGDRIHWRVPRYDLELEIELLRDLAPRTAASLAAALPAAGLATSENTYGSVVCLRLPNYHGPLEPENATISPIPGDVFVYEREHGVELVAYYERMGSVPAGVPFDSCGPKPGNRVGVIVSALSPTTREAARSIWQRGAAWGIAAAADSAALASVEDDREAAEAEVRRRLAVWAKRTRRDHLGSAPTGERRVALIVPEYNARTEVELAPKLAPHTSDNVWNHLPVETTLMHGRYSGPEMFTQVGGKQWHWTPKLENAIANPIPGDLVLYVDPPPRIQINYFHDRDAIPYGTPPPELGTRVGQSVGDFHHFAEACVRVGYDGWKTLIVERVVQSSV
jgi:hypothetical protein